MYDSDLDIYLVVKQRNGSILNFDFDIPNQTSIGDVL